MVFTSGLAAAAVLMMAFAFAVVYANLPPIDALTDYRPKIPLRVFTADGVLIGEFGEERREFVAFRDVPQHLKDAVLAAEDDRFYEHPGVDYAGIARAALANVLTGRRRQGGSTITMQIARTFYLSSERTYVRKLYEIALALKIESNLSKERIFEIYLNQIFLGQRSYGFAAAAQTYFGKRLSELTIAEAAMLAGIAPAPSAYNPISSLRRAKARQQYVLGRMLALGKIDRATYEAALAQPIRTREHALAMVEGGRPRLHAEHAAELVRQLMFDVFREETYTRGLRVHTTLVSHEQQAAAQSLRQQVLEYDRRAGYRGPEAFIELPTDPQRREQVIEDAIAEAIDSASLLPAVVLEASPKRVLVALSGTETVEVTGEGLRFAARALEARAQPARRIVPGAVVRVSRNAKGTWEIVQLPQVEAAFVAADVDDGAVRAFVGGFDFNLNKFNHVTQAWRQPGSAFKPFIYAAALEKGFTPSTLINDAPIVIDPALTGGQLWEPRNFEGTFDGPMRLRQALARSKNLVSIRILQAIGPQYAQAYITRFGFEPERHPPYLTMALGAGSVTPWQLMAAYAVFASGGYRVQPYLITRVTDASGRTLMEVAPRKPFSEADRVLDARTAYVMDSLLRDVTRVGTAARAAVLKRGDLAGKTGTTNDSHDAWFAGYGGGLVGVSWVGFDQPRPLGERETGGGLALPIWIGYMATALKDRAERWLPMPDGVVTIGGEVYFAEFAPGQGVAAIGLEDGLAAEQQKKADTVRDQVF
ncbi:MAG: penicillin-binding protein 1A [Sutterellaceae bacterium]|nr:penicillin-binding protein 1A [Burkholderiaceae bacterium]MDW8430109.1 penicillin-binding protein 1A [Sutterellaceae bacterium]